ncbi:collagen-like protein [Bizionia sediminis]|uniref:Collagen-like protein n=1 Tax=Bizionia sediminis TaxID=1737064 RepID=A0ABW5KT13_9FLAO
MKTHSKTKFVILALLVAFSFSCSPEDGATGPQGPPGADGTNGTNGADGADGTNGADGADGNANVQTFIFDTSAESGSLIVLMVPEITQDVLDNDVILSYFKPANSSLYYPMPGGGYSARYITRPYYRVGQFYISFHNWDGTDYSLPVGDILEMKIILIESSSNKPGEANQGKQKIYNELRQAGVDINDYQAVSDYYGLAH